MQLRNTLQDLQFRKEKFDDSKFYHFFYLTSRQSQRENRQKYVSSLPWIVQTNNSHAISYQTETDFHASAKVNKLTVKTVNGIRRQFKDNRPVEAFELSQVLRQFLTFLRASIDSASSRSTKPVCTILTGHKAATFDISKLLLNGGENFIAELSSISSIRFADTLTLLKSLIKASTLSSKTSKIDIQSLARVLFTNIYFKQPLTPTTP